MPMSLQRVLMIAIAGTLTLSAGQSALAAAPKGRPADRQKFTQLVALRSRPTPSARPLASSRVEDPNSKAGVDSFNRLVARQGRTPPPIPRSLLITPRPPEVQQLKSFRENYILSLYRFRGLRRGGTAGGVYFTPPSGTPYYPVDPVNIFSYFPVYRVN